MIKKGLHSDTIKTNLKKNNKYDIFKTSINTPLQMLWLIAFIALFTFWGIKFITDGLTTTTTYALTYKEKGNIDYKVYLKKNNYFEEKYLEKNRQYVASLIDHIDIDFNYVFKTNKKVNYKYYYYIVANLKATEPDDETAILYNKNYMLTEKKELKKSNKNKYSIKKNININYDKYNNIINQFKSDYILSLNSKLNVKLVVETKADYKDFKDSINTISTTELNIPLSEKTINISIQTKETDNKREIQEHSKFELINILYIILGILLILIDIYLLIKYFLNVKKILGKPSKYNKKIKKILNEYDRIITNTTKFPNLKSYEVLNVTKFEELVDASEKVEKPILYCETEKNKKSEFIVIDKKIAYYYQIDADETNN